MQLKKEFIQQVQDIISSSKDRAIRSIDSIRVLMYWEIGKLILEEEQQGKERAGYGEFLIKTLSDSLKIEHGSSFSVRELQRYRQFYRTFPNTSALRTQFSWTHYKTLISIANEDKREFYIAEAVKNNWTSRELERQINSQLFERLLLSNNVKSVLEVANQQKLPTEAKEIIKDPMVLEFLGLKREAAYYEKDIESSIIKHLQDFLLEFENKTIGVLLCADKNDAVMKITLPENTQNIVASKYELYLPSEQALLSELKSEIEKLNKTE